MLTLILIKRTDMRFINLFQLLYDESYVYVEITNKYNILLLKNYTLDKCNGLDKENITDNMTKQNINTIFQSVIRSFISSTSKNATQIITYYNNDKIIKIENNQNNINPIYIVIVNITQFGGT
jgi:hypothetical protein